MFLIDANIFVEVLLDREHSEDSKRFIEKADKEGITLVITSFTLHTIAVIMERLKGIDSYAIFLEAIMDMQSLLLYSTTPSEEIEICSTSKNLGLDFDDSLQYFVAKKLNLTLVSFDKHFDKTDIERVEPKDVL